MDPYEIMERIGAKQSVVRFEQRLLLDQEREGRESAARDTRARIRKYEDDIAILREQLDQPPADYILY